MLFNVYVANAVACYQRWQRSSTAVNMTSVWKRSMQTVYACGGAGGGSQQRGRRWGRCSIYRHRLYKSVQLTVVAI